MFGLHCFVIPAPQHGLLIFDMHNFHPLSQLLHTCVVEMFISLVWYLRWNQHFDVKRDDRVDSLAPRRWSPKPKYVIFRLISRLNMLNISSKIAYRWMPPLIMTHHCFRWWLGGQRSHFIQPIEVPPKLIDIFFHFKHIGLMPGIRLLKPKIICQIMPFIVVKYCACPWPKTLEC